MTNLVLIGQAAEASGYAADHIRYLARKGFIQGKKYGGVWLIDLDSLNAYEARMKAEGTQKHTPSRYRDEEA